MEIQTYLETNPSITEAVVAYCINGSQVLLGRRKTSSTDLGINNIAGLGGKLEQNEAYTDALIRELNEEVGIIPIKYVDMGRVVFLNPHNTKWNLAVQIYIVNKWEGDPRESDETEPMWFDIDKIPLDNMFSDNRYWLPQVLTGQKVDGVFMFEEEHGISESRVNFS